MTIDEIALRLLQLDADQDIAYQCLGKAGVGGEGINAMLCDLHDFALDVLGFPADSFTFSRDYLSKPWAPHCAGTLPSQHLAWLKKQLAKLQTTQQRSKRDSNASQGKAVS